MKMDYFGYRGLPDEARARPVLLVVGKADYLRSLVVDDLLDRSLGGGDRALNLVAREVAPEVDITAILDDLRTPSLLGGARVVHLRGVEALEKDGRRRLEEYVARPASGAVLILEGTGLPANTRLFRAVEKQGIVIQCRPLYETPPPWGRRGGREESELSRWIRLRVEDRGKRITPRAIAAAVEAWGNDLASIDGALDQARVLIEESEEIGEEEIRSLSPSSRADPVYRVVDLVLKGDRKGAMRRLRSVFLHGMPDAAGRGRDNPGAVTQILIRGLHGRLTSLWRAHLLRRQGVGEKEVLQELGIAPFLARRFWHQVEANPLPTIPDRLGVILEAERSIKTGEAEPMAAAESLVVRLGPPGRGSPPAGPRRSG